MREKIKLFPYTVTGDGSELCSQGDGAHRVQQQNLCRLKVYSQILRVCRYTRSSFTKFRRQPHFNRSTPVTSAAYNSVSTIILKRLQQMESESRLPRRHSTAYCALSLSDTTVLALSDPINFPICFFYLVSPLSITSHCHGTGAIVCGLCRIGAASSQFSALWAWLDGFAVAVFVQKFLSSISR